jgi:hypothetical protein
VALFKDGELVFMLHRSQIERLDAEGVGNELKRGFDAYCSAKGPSVPRQKFEDNFAPVRCSSTIPEYRGDR